MATAPQAIWNLWYRIRDLYLGAGQQDEVLSGIVGDSLHSFGFHLSYNDLKRLGKAGSDYSLHQQRDRQGGLDHPDDASALDVHFGPVGMVIVTKRLIAAAKANDPRMRALYEFCGTTNGKSPHPYTVDTHTDDPNNFQGWDVSHVTHVHLSIHRDVCNNFTAIQGVADVIAGIPLKYAPTDPKWSDTVTQDEINKMIDDRVTALIVSAQRAVLLGGDHGGEFTHENYPQLVKDEGNGVLDRLHALEDAK